MVSGTEYMSPGMGFIAVHTNPVSVSSVNVGYEPRVSKENRRLGRREMGPSRARVESACRACRRGAVAPEFNSELALLQPLP